MTGSLPATVSLDKTNQHEARPMAKQAKKLGLVVFYHDTDTCFLSDGRVVPEEVKNALDAGIAPEEIAVSYDQPRAIQSVMLSLLQGCHGDCDKKPRESMLIVRGRDLALEARHKGTQCTQSEARCRFQREIIWQGCPIAGDCDVKLLF